MDIQKLIEKAIIKEDTSQEVVSWLLRLQKLLKELDFDTVIAFNEELSEEKKKRLNSTPYAKTIKSAFHLNDGEVAFFYSLFRLGTNVGTTIKELQKN